MEMFCYQCQETAGNTGCVKAGVCGKKPVTAGLQDALIQVCRGVASAALGSVEGSDDFRAAGRFLTGALFATITNANFDDERLTALIGEGLSLRDRLVKRYGDAVEGGLPGAARWVPGGDLAEAGKKAGVLSTGNEDIRSLRELLIYGLKGIAAYAHHAEILGYEDDAVYASVMKGLDATARDLGADTLTALVLETGKAAVDTMALLDRANTETYGHPRITKIATGVRGNPGILVSGHDLKDLEELLRQTEGTGVDVYTHGEMLPAHSYPAFAKYGHLAGNYGGSWGRQGEGFASFNGPILMTTNCIIPVRDAYRGRIFTTGMAGYPGVEHIPDRRPGGEKDFSKIIELAGHCPSPDRIEDGEVTGGFGHDQVGALAGKIVEAVKAGDIRKFVVMAGCDGRHKDRSYFTEVAENLPKDAVILTAGCAKYRYNKLDLGDIGGIPRVIDAGQCNDSYSLAVTALKLKDAFGLGDVNDLPIAFDIAWYEQKAVAVLLALLALGFKNIRLGPTLPAFLSPNVAGVLVEKFGIMPTGEAAADIEKIMA
ncbi:MAG: hydroxylamine reductase [Candidatus Krumholzibacteria bacterium]|nr:hydroxylamine reductase [Candidatus Krumholzibacteria bacterium]